MFIIMLDSPMEVKMLNKRNDNRQNWSRRNSSRRNKSRRNKSRRNRDKSLDAQAHTNITASTPHSGAYCSRYLEAQNGATYIQTHLVLEVSCSISLLNAVQTNVTPDWREVGALAGATATFECHID